MSCRPRRVQRYFNLVETNKSLLAKTGFLSGRFCLLERLHSDPEIKKFLNSLPVINLMKTNRDLCQVGPEPGPIGLSHKGRKGDVVLLGLLDFCHSYKNRILCKHFV